MYDFVFTMYLFFVLIPIQMDSCVTFYHVKELRRKKK